MTPSIADLIEQIKRDVDVLAGPPEYYAGDLKAFFEERIAKARALVQKLEGEERYRDAITGANPAATRKLCDGLSR